MSKHKLEVPRSVPWQRILDPGPSSIDDDVEPGERKRKEQFRRKTVGDLAVPLAASVCCGAIAAGVAYGTGADLRSLLLTGTITTGAVFVATGLRVVWTDGASVLELVETITRTDLNGDHVIGGTREIVHLYHVVAEVREGIHSIYADLGILSGEQANAWHLFCRDVRDGNRRFTGNEADAAGVDRTWFTEVLVPRWASWDPQLQLIDPDTVGPKQTMQLRERGKEMVAAFARIPPTPHVS